MLLSTLLLVKVLPKCVRIIKFKLAYYSVMAK